MNPLGITVRPNGVRHERTHSADFVQHSFVSSDKEKLGATLFDFLKGAVGLDPKIVSIGSVDLLDRTDFWADVQVKRA
jgi:hypothetical protein